MTTVRTRSLPDRLAAAAAGCTSVETLAQVVFDEVAKVVSYDFACIATTDPATGLITRTFKTRELPDGDEGFAAAEYGGPDINQFAELATRRIPVGVLSVDTDGHVERCRRFREYMTPRFGFTDEIRVVCRSRTTAWAALAVYRGAADPAFTRQDGQVLASVHELIADLVLRALFAAEPRAGDNADTAVLILDADDRVTDLTAAAERQIDELGGWENGSLPSNALSVATVARAGDAPVTSRVLGRSGRWLSLRAIGLAGGRSVAITIDAAPAQDIGRLTLAARGLTTREQEIARLVLQGAATKAIASTLHLSPHTVQDHLKAIFGKLGVSSRREMIAQLVAGG